MKKTFLFITLFGITTGSVIAQDSVSVNSSISYQTIEGWGHGGGILGFTGGAWSMLDSSIANPVNYQILDFVTDDLGLTGSRTWEVGPRVDGTGMDDGDCDVINWSKFQANTLPVTFANYLIYFKNRVLAQGIQPSFYSSPGYPTHATDQKPWIMYHPGERAQQLWANALYMKNTYGININYAVIYNEPGGLITSTILADDIKALGPRFISNGLSTKSQFAEAVAPLTDWNFITPVQNDTAMWSYVGRISYHNYGTADPYRSYIRDLGLTKSIRTAQTEMGNPTFDDLYSDLTLGGVSYWEVAYSASSTLVPSSGLTSFTPSATYIRLRELMHYVRPGATRIAAAPNDTMLNVLSFIKSGAVTTVLENKNAAAKTVILTGLPAGMYGVSKATAGATFFTEAGTQTVTAGGTLTVSANGGSAITTVYPRTAVNQPPTIMTWGTNPGYVVAPATSATLSVTASDPELNTLTYQWTVSSKPAGSSPVIVSPTATTTSVTGLSIPGTYVFNISVSDGVNISSKKAYLTVYSTNPPPVLGGAGFRINTPYGLVFGNPGDTTHAIIELPTTAVTLQVGISDLANSDFTGRGTWSLVSQPAGASVSISATTYIYVSIRANVTGMTIPGDYVFQVNVTNPGHPDLVTRIICTVNPASLPPMITSITPAQDTMTLPVSATLLTAVTSDPGGLLLRHWWAIKSTPVGAKPLFNHQGLSVSNVSGLTVPGTYTFTLRAFDDLHMTTKDITLTVKPGIAGIANTQPNNGFDVYPNPATDILNIQLHDSKEQLSAISLYNVLGQLAMGQQVKGGNSIAISIRSLPAGTYFLNLKTQTKTYSQKIIKE
ncbi:MAG: T9SS type A sorting domain-containing protein [Taibaiella sp.]|nr:T9SS type A sorting domain-containing protein [Taibaiella sp.]